MSEPSPEYRPVRREPRMALMLPVTVKAHAPDGAVLEDEALMQDVCAGGMAFRTTLPLRKGQVVHLEAPVPRSFRKHAIGERSYPVYAIVRNVLVDDDGCRVGTMFFGAEPPSGYNANPAARYVLPSDVVPDWSAPVTATAEGDPEPGELRRHPRFSIFVDFALEQVDEFGMVIDEERTVADNVSLGGVRVYTSHPFQKGAVVNVREVNGRFEARALVVGSFTQGGVRRLNLHFLDGREPTHLVPGH